MSSNNTRVMIFIDGSNLFWASRARGIQIEYSKLISFLANNRSLIRAYYYGAEKVPPDPMQTGFYEKLRFQGIEVITKPLVKRTSYATLVATGQRVQVIKEEEKGVDVALITDMLSMGYKNAYDVAISVGADADFENAIRNIKLIPKRVEIAAFSDNDTSTTPPRYSTTVCREMRMCPDLFIPLENHVSKFRR
ncbi:MAG: NYN domain-containing protein [Candidatus Bathyarchaeota archaeon]|nr:NYN domain-containing protein [Candidatus Bathyarchaeota archaeon]